MLVASFHTVQILKTCRDDGFNCLIAPPSVTIIEGTVTSLQEEDGCVTGVQYKDKESGDVKVRAEAALSCNILPHRECYESVNMCSVGNPRSADHRG